MKNWRIESIEEEIISFLDKKKKVYIESGAAVDRILSYDVTEYKKYSWEDYSEKETSFTTTNCIFPKVLQLTDFSEVDCSYFKDAFFVTVG